MEEYKVSVFIERQCVQGESCDNDALHVYNAGLNGEQNQRYLLALAEKPVLQVLT